MRFLLLAAVSAVAILAGAAHAVDSGECLDCHDAPEFVTASPDGPTTTFSASVHGALDCNDCHALGEDHPEGNAPERVDCAGCHPDEVSEHRNSVHGRSLADHGEGAAGCTDCHGPAHGMLAPGDPNSPVNHQRLATTCGNCHADPELVARFGINVVNPLVAYEQSVHAAAVHNGNGGPSCNDCHGAHDTASSEQPESRINHANVPQTCGNCHSQITAAYLGSVHGAALQRGVRDAPVCTDCHGEHRILSPADAGSPVSTTNQSKITCGRCHGDVRLNEKYGLPSDRVPSYEDSFHGLAVRGGATTVASCASCHGVHDILPSENPASHVNPGRLAETCNQCHAGAGSRFAIGPVHVVETDVRFPIVYYIRLVYLLLIAGTIGGMLIHVGMDFYRKCRSPALRALAAAPSSGAVRMIAGFRIAHGLVMISFPILVWSGFALTFPDQWWAWPLLAPGPEFRGLIHRSAALVICTALVLHVAHLLIDRRARACIRQMVPGLEDLRELGERLKWYLGWRNTPVHSPRVGYIEKVEYLAFWWGMLVMAATGFMLWFENFMLRDFPSWVPAAMTAIHFYEAVLASLAILVWHSYWTVFDPAVYPMDMSWLTGRAPASREWEREPNKSGVNTNDDHEKGISP